MAFLNNLFGGGNAGAGLMRKNQRQTEGAINLDNARAAGIFGSFGPQFYDKAMKAYENQAMPGVEGEFLKSQKGLGAGLARKGLTNSSSALQLGSSLAKAMNQEKTGVVDAAQRQTDQLRTGQAQQEAGMTQEANQANRPSSEAQRAIGTASEFQAPGWFEGVGKTLGNWANFYLADKNKSTWSGFNLAPASYGGSLSGSYDSPPANESPAKNIS